MPYINDKKYLTLPQQVKQNKDDIVVIETLYDDDILALQEKDALQDGEIGDNSDDIEQLQDALASGGVIVTRKTGLSVDLATVLSETKIVFDVEVAETNDPTAITKDANNDTVLITEGKYNIEFPISVANGNGAAQSCTITIYVKDSVTTIETLLKTVNISLTGMETVNTKPQVDYTRIAGNNQIVIFKQSSSKTNVEIKDNSETHITSYFTTAGTGVVTQTRNIAPTSPSTEGLAGTEATQQEVNEANKTRLDAINQAAQGSGNNLLMTNGGLIKNVADPVDDQDAVTKKYFTDNPTGIPYVTDNMTPDIQATESVNGDKTNQSLINIDNAALLNASFGKIVASQSGDSGSAGDVICNFSAFGAGSYDFIITDNTNLIAGFIEFKFGNSTNTGAQLYAYQAPTTIGSIKVGTIQSTITTPYDNKMTIVATNQSVGAFAGPRMYGTFAITDETMQRVIGDTVKTIKLAATWGNGTTDTFDWVLIKREAIV